MSLRVTPAALNKVWQLMLSEGDCSQNFVPILVVAVARVFSMALHLNSRKRMMIGSFSYLLQGLIL